MLKGIDISNWQAGFDVASSDVDFVIVKATGGTGYVDQSCDGFVQECIKSGKLWGFYHFAKDGYKLANGREEADYFVKHTLGYFYKGIPVLDLEDVDIPDWREYAIDFCSRVKELTGVNPIVYTGLKGCTELANSYVTENCGIWFAGYPLGYIDYWIEENPVVHSYYSIPESCNVVMWQFTSNLPLGGMHVDANYAYMDADQWMMYVVGDSGKRPEPKPEPGLDDLENALNVLADYVWKNYFGTGEQCKDAIYEAVQKRVNARA